MSMNEPLRDDQFIMAQPPGVTVINLDEKRRNAAKEFTPTVMPKPAQ
jgi:hypothetical protein